MRRLARRLFSLCSAGSLVLGTVVGAAWCTGYSGSPSPVWRESAAVTGPRLSVGVDGPRRVVVVGVITPDDAALGRGMFEHYFGFDYGDMSAYSGGGNMVYLGRSRALSVPIWLVVSLSAVLPGMWLVTRMIRPKALRGHCVSCGYDLRATPGRCPECGTPASPPKSVAV